MNLQQKQTNFAQPNGKSGTVLAKEIAFVIAARAVFTRKRNKGTGVLLRNNSHVDSNR